MSSECRQWIALIKLEARAITEFSKISKNLLLPSVTAFRYLVHTLELQFTHR